MLSASAAGTSHRHYENDQWGWGPAPVLSNELARAVMLPWAIPGALVHRYREMGRAAQVDPAIPHDIAIERQTGEPAGQVLERDGGFQPGQ